MANLYKPAFTQLKEYDLEINDSNFQYFLTAKKCCLLPMYFHKEYSKWYVNVEGLESFISYTKKQLKTDYQGDELILLSQISTELDRACPFNYTELGGLCKIGTLQYIVNKSGIYKRKKQIYKESYCSLKSFQEATYSKYEEDFIEIGDKIFH